LKYIYKIHEVVQEEDNYVVIVPKNDSFIIDYRCDYMENRTNSRNESDLKILYEELEESPDDPRVFFYLAKTYNNMKNYEKCYEYLLKRIDCKKEGFKLELVDATFEAARLANFQLNKTWSECEKLYLKAYDLEPKKPESLYFIGVHYYLENNFDIAFNYLKKAFEIGYPADYQFNVKPIISFRYIPKFLTLLCYQKKEYNLGFQASKLYLENNDLQYG
jgi:tetratricopeptide (TPR) repeat protein